MPPRWKCAILCLVCAASLIGSASAQTPGPDVRERQRASAAGDDLAADGKARGRPHARDALLTAIGSWLSSEYGLGRSGGNPAVVVVPARRLAALRYRGVPSDRLRPAGAFSPADRQDDILAVYDDAAQTIFVADGWAGATPAELSVLVHEMVHHLQNLSGAKFACPEEREKMAFDAQQRWLGYFGSDLNVEFGLDPLTLLVRTHCLP